MFLCFILHFFCTNKEQQDPLSQDKQTDKLRSRKHSHTSSNQITPEKFQDKPADTVKDQITGGHLSILFFMLRNIKKDSKMQKIQHTGINLCWNQCYMIRCKIRILKCNRKYAICLTAIAAACLQASDPSKSLRKCHRWHHQIKIFPEICFFDVAIQTARQNPADNTSIHNKSI